LMAPIDAAGRPVRAGNLGTQAVVRGSFNKTGRPLLLAGRLPRADRADEALINASGAAATGLHVGSRLHLRGWIPSQAEEPLQGSEIPPTGPEVDVHLVGVARF